MIGQFQINKPDVTVVIPTYNSGRYIVAALDSVLSQQGVSLEVIVVDDGSTDDTLVYLEPYLADARVSADHNPQNLGPNANFNKCIKLGSGRYIIVFGHDDVMYENHLASLVQAMDSAPQAAIGYTQADWIDENGNFIRRADHVGHLPVSYTGGRDEIVDLLSHDNYINPSTVIYRREYIPALTLDNGNMTTGHLLAGDWEQWLRIARKRPDFVFLHQASIGYRIHEGQISSRFYADSRPLREHAEILEMMLSEKEILDRLQKSAASIWGLYYGRLINYPAAIQEEMQERTKSILCQLFGRKPKFDPAISLLLLAENNEELVFETLDSLNACTGHDFEVVLINGGSQAIESRLATYGFPVTYVRGAAGGMETERRSDAEKVARGKQTIRIEAGTKLSSTWFDKMYQEQC